jgi:hypothetical protein
MASSVKLARADERPCVIVGDLVGALGEDRLPILAPAANLVVDRHWPLARIRPQPRVSDCDAGKTKAADPAGPQAGRLVQLRCVIACLHEPAIARAFGWISALLGWGRRSQPGVCTAGRRSPPGVCTVEFPVETTLALH